MGMWGGGTAGFCCLAEGSHQVHNQRPKEYKGWVIGTKVVTLSSTGTDEAAMPVSMSGRVHIQIHAAGRRFQTPKMLAQGEDLHTRTWAASYFCGRYAWTGLTITPPKMAPKRANTLLQELYNFFRGVKP